MSVDTLTRLLLRRGPLVPWFGWGSVTQTDPLLVQVDGETTGVPPLEVVSGAATAVVGARVWCMRLGSALRVLEVRAGVQPWSAAAGIADISIASSLGTTTVALPAARFTVPPVVTASVHSYNHRLIARGIALDVDEIKLDVYTPDGSSYTGSVSVAWMAVQMTADAASG